MEAPNSSHMDAVYTALNFIPVLTLVAATYAAGAFAQRVKGIERQMAEQEREMGILRRRLHKTNNNMQRYIGAQHMDEEEEDEK